MYARDSGSITGQFCSRFSETGDDTYQAVHILWDDAVDTDFSEPDSEEEEDEEEEDKKQD